MDKKQVKYPSSRITLNFFRSPKAPLPLLPKRGDKSLFEARKNKQGYVGRMPGMLKRLSTPAFLNDVKRDIGEIAETLMGQVSK